MVSSSSVTGARRLSQIRDPRDEALIDGRAEILRTGAGLLAGARKGRTLNALVVAAALVSLSFRGEAETVILTTTDYRPFRTELLLHGRITAVGVIDSGSTFVAICEKMARDLGLPLGAPVELRTVNGTTSAPRVRLQTVQIGRIVVTDVEGVVDTHASCTEALVGLSLMGKLYKVILTGTTLKLVGRSARIGK
jgi:clan AA aspartic protease (TIGR02281 family)